MSAREPFTIARCEYWNGTGLPCKKGVPPAQVIDEDHRVPCVVIRGITGKVACDLRVMPEIPTAGELGPAAKMLAAVLDGDCPKCGERVHGTMEFNGAILAMPCRHVLRSARE